MILRSPCKNLKPYNNPFCGNNSQQPRAAHALRSEQFVEWNGDIIWLLLQFKNTVQKSKGFCCVRFLSDFFLCGAGDFFFFLEEVTWLQRNQMLLSGCTKADKNPTHFVVSPSTLAAPFHIMPTWASCWPCRGACAAPRWLCRRR
jgi:hypothetical protein